MQTAELRALLTWAMPTVGAWDKIPEVDVVKADDSATWLADRFLLNAVDHWATSSLHLEYRWANGEVPVEVDPSEITLRSLPVDKLNAEIARRAVTGDEGEYHKNLLNRSVELLEARRFSDAVSLFEAALALSPTLWVRNCLAFCLIPQEPMFAVHMLVELLDEGFHPPLVRANLAAASRLCGAVEEARLHAAAGLAALDGRSQSSAFLWRFGESEVVLAEVDLERYLRNALAWSDPGPSGTSYQ